MDPDPRYFLKIYWFFFLTKHNFQIWCVTLFAYFYAKTWLTIQKSRHFLTSHFSIVKIWVRRVNFFCTFWFIFFSLRFGSVDPDIFKYLIISFQRKTIHFNNWSWRWKLKVEILFLKFSTKNMSHGLNLNRGSHSLNSASGNVNYRSKTTKINKKIYVEKKSKTIKYEKKEDFGSQVLLNTWYPVSSVSAHPAALFSSALNLPSPSPSSLLSSSPPPSSSRSSPSFSSPPCWTSAGSP